LKSWNIGVLGKTTMKHPILPNTPSLQHSITPVGEKQIRL
jgi:hypothetical protein